MYTIEFQQRGLPHAHLFLFLHPEDKHLIANQIDKIISAEIFDKNTNEIEYLTIQNYMMCGLCGYDQKIHHT